MKFQSNVKVLREKAGMSAYELSMRCGFVSNNRISSGYVNRAEKGDMVNIYTALLIYRELKKAGVCTSFDEVFWLDD